MTHDYDTQHVRRQLRKWVADEGPRRGEANGPDDGADLLQEGWIDSLGLMSLITHVEDLLGRALSDDEMRMQNFVSIDSIVRALFRQAKV
jgi:acyl carrier protein